MTPQELKNSILQRAIEGKLVEQRAEEGTGEELYETIQAEKKKLIKEGKIKKQKALPEITEEEIPFEIPESWKWVRLDGVFQFINGDRGKNYPAKSKLKESGEIPFISAANLKDGTVDEENLLYLNEIQYEKLGSGKLQKNDIVLCIRGSLGKCCIYPFEKGAIASSLVILRNYKEIHTNYALHYLNSSLFSSETRKYDNGTAQPNLSAQNAKKILFPLPPLNEQKRIVEKIEELMLLVEAYEESWKRLEELNKKFPEDMKKSLLQEAIKGKLVEQRAEEGSGEELYKVIQAEKKKLIKEGKIKKQKALPEITEDEMPFEIPESWKWVRLGNIVSLLGDGLHGTPKYDINGSYYFINGNNLVDGKIFITDRTKKVNENEWEKYKKPLDDSSVLVSINGTIGNLSFYNSEKVVLGKSACYFNLVFPDLKYYIYYVLKSAYFLKHANKNATGTTIKNVSLKVMRELIFPLPPLNEQKRIVERLEELLPLCDQLMTKAE